jgi:hypothetical protein
MKKLFHPGMIAGIVFMMSSCSKSASELAVNENAAKANTDNAAKSHVVTSNPGIQLSGPVITSQLSKFYPFINQPYYLEMGDNGGTINSGQIAVFYVTLSPDVANEIPVTATLSTIDDATGQTIETYNLISYINIDRVDAIVPEELIGTPFMLAMVYLDNQYIDKTVTLTSEIEFNNAYSPARLERAFTVIQ